MSEFARLVHHTTESVKGTPAERAALVRELQGQIDAGTYNVNARMVAERLVEGLQAGA